MDKGVFKKMVLLKNFVAVISAVLLAVPFVYSLQLYAPKVEGSIVTLSYDGEPPFLINIGKDENVMQAGGYLLIRTYEKSFSYDMSFAYNPSGVFYYAIIDGEGSVGSGSFYITPSCIEEGNECLSNLECCSNSCENGVCKVGGGAGEPPTGSGAGGGAGETPSQLPGGSPPATTGSGNLPQPKQGTCVCEKGSCVFTGSNCYKESGIICDANFFCSNSNGFFDESDDVEPNCCKGSPGRCFYQMMTIQTCRGHGYSRKPGICTGNDYSCDCHGGGLGQAYCSDGYCSECSSNGDCSSEACHYCGDGKVDATEGCDAIDTNNDGINDQIIYTEGKEQCSNYAKDGRPFKEGTLSCTENCRVDTSGCVEYPDESEKELICVRGTCQNPDSECAQAGNVICEGPIFGCSTGYFEEGYEPNCCAGKCHKAFYSSEMAKCDYLPGTVCASYHGPYCVDGLCVACRNDADCRQYDKTCGNGKIDQFEDGTYEKCA